MTMYELQPDNGQKSFCGRAKVVIADNGIRTLFSYNTPVCSFNGADFVDHGCDRISNTTVRHVRAFTASCGVLVKGDTAKWLDQLSYVPYEALESKGGV